MTAWGIDLAFLAVVMIVALATALTGAVRAAVMSVGVVFSGLMAMNFYEPLSDSARNLLNTSEVLARYADFAALVLLFTTCMLSLRMLVSRVLRERPELPALLESSGRWVGGLFVGGVTAAVLMTAVHTFPGSRDFGGYFPPEREQRTGAIARWAPDVRWLGFTQHVSEHVFRVRDGQRVFDGPHMTIGNHDGRWPTFAYRYARWRERLSAK